MGLLNKLICKLSIIQISILFILYDIGRCDTEDNAPIKINYSNSNNTINAIFNYCEETICQQIKTTDTTYLNDEQTYNDCLQEHQSCSQTSDFEIQFQMCQGYCFQNITSKYTNSNFISYQNCQNRCLNVASIKKVFDNSDQETNYLFYKLYLQCYEGNCSNILIDNQKSQIFNYYKTIYSICQDNQALCITAKGNYNVTQIKNNCYDACLTNLQDNETDGKIDSNFQSLLTCDNNCFNSTQTQINQFYLDQQTNDIIFQNSIEINTMFLIFLSIGILFLIVVSCTLIYFMRAHNLIYKNKYEVNFTNSDEESEAQEIDEDNQEIEDQDDEDDGNGEDDEENENEEEGQQQGVDDEEEVENDENQEQHKIQFNNEYDDDDNNEDQEQEEELEDSQGGEEQDSNKNRNNDLGYNSQLQSQGSVGVIGNKNRKLSDNTFKNKRKRGLVQVLNQLEQDNNSQDFQQQQNNKINIPEQIISLEKQQRSNLSQKSKQTQNQEQNNNNHNNNDNTFSQENYDLEGDQSQHHDMSQDKSKNYYSIQMNSHKNLKEKMRNNKRDRNKPSTPSSHSQSSQIKKKQNDKSPSPPQTNQYPQQQTNLAKINQTMNIQRNSNQNLLIDLQQQGQSAQNFSPDSKKIHNKSKFPTSHQQNIINLDNMFKQMQNQNSSSFDEQSVQSKQNNDQNIQEQNFDQNIYNIRENDIKRQTIQSATSPFQNINQNQIISDFCFADQSPQSNTNQVMLQKELSYHNQSESSQFSKLLNQIKKGNIPQNFSQKVMNQQEYNEQNFEMPSPYLLNPQKIQQLNQIQSPTEGLNNINQFDSNAPVSNPIKTGQISSSDFNSINFKSIDQKQNVQNKQEDEYLLKNKQQIQSTNNEITNSDLEYRSPKQAQFKLTNNIYESSIKRDNPINQQVIQTQNNNSSEQQKSKTSKVKNLSEQEEQDLSQQDNREIQEGVLKQNNRKKIKRLNKNNNNQ